MNNNEFQNILDNIGNVEFCGKGRIIYTIENGNLYANGKLKNINNWTFRTSKMANLIECCEIEISFIN